MRLKSITLRNYRGVTESTVDFSDGVTVVEGPNEVGKSSIPEALRLLREVKASSKAAQVRSIKPVHRDVGPEAQIELVTGHYELTFRKRWIKDPITELTVRSPRPEQLTSDQAHERYNAILAETVDADLLRAMEMIQGESMKQPDLAQVTSLHRALDQSAEQPADHDELIERIEAEFRTYFTAGGRPTGDYRDAAAQVEDHRLEVEELRRDSSELDLVTDDHRISSQRVLELRGELDRAREELARREEDDRALASLREAVEQSQQELDNASRDLRDAQAASRERNLLVTDLETRQNCIAEHQQIKQDLEVDHLLAQERWGEARKAEEVAQARFTEARNEAHLAQRALTQHLDHAERQRLAEQVDRAHEATHRRLQAQATLQGSAVDNDTVALLSGLETDVRVAQSARDAAATAVVVEALGSTPIAVGGQMVGQTEPLRASVLETLTIEVAGVARVEISPGTPPAELEKSLRTAREALEQALRVAGVASVAEARGAAQTRQEAQQQLDKAQEALQHVLGDHTLDELREEHASLGVRLEGMVRDPDANRGDLEAAQQLAQAAEEEADSALKSAAAALEQARNDADDAREAWVRATEAVNAARAEQVGAAERLQLARELASDAAVEETVARRLERVKELEALTNQRRSELAASHPDQVEIHLVNARDLVRSKNNDLNEVSSRVRSLEMFLEKGAKLGLYDKLHRAEALLDAAREKHERLHRAAQAAKLLHETMVRRRAEVQQKYVAPFKSEIERLGKLVFGQSFQTDISPSLSITSRTLDDITVPFECLSSGTQEQLSLLGRLASARLVAGDTGAPVILDDALGFADPERLRALGAVFNFVGASAQVILLTCQPERYASLGGARVVRLSHTQLPAS